MALLLYCLCHFDVFFLFMTIQSCSGITVEILKPIKPTGEEAALLIAPGAFINGQAYKPLALQISEISDLRLWVVLLEDFFDDLVNPPQLTAAIKESNTKLQQQGFNKKSPVFLSGHSLGGQMVAVHGKQSHEGLTGIILFAAYLTRGNRLKDYPLPVLTISGDLDGLTRITRIVDTFEELYQDSISDSQAKYRTPVIVMSGVNHGQFASGTMPSAVLQNDLDPDVSNITAHQLIAKYTCAFISNVINNNNSRTKEVLEAGFNETYSIVEPLGRIRAVDLNVHATSYWTEVAQKLIAGLQNNTQIHVTDGEVSELSLATSTPEARVENSTLFVETYTTVSRPFNPLDVTVDPQSPLQLQVKMKSKDGLKFIFPAGKFQTENMTCRDINEECFLYALANSSEVARNRWVNRGRRINFQSDSVSFNTATWLLQQLSLDYTSSALSVRSPVYSQLFNEKDESGGFIYCKLLSPYRAMEWIYVDSFRKL